MSVEISFRSVKDNFDNYREDCVILKQSLQQLINDLEYEDKNWSLRYAIDFSELYNYLLPQKATKKTSLFWDDGAVDLITALQELMLKHLFSLANDNPLILLPTYAVELDAFLERQVLKELEDVIKLTLSIFNDVGKLRLHPTVQKFLNANEPISDAKKTEFISFVQESFPRILLLIDPLKTPASIRERYNKLIKNNTFTTLYDMGVEVNVDINDSIANSWYKILLEKRKLREPAQAAGTSYIDSQSVAIIHRANKLLANEKIRLVLVTRSKHMHDVQEENKDLKSDTGDILRHTRIFNLLYRKAELGRDKFHKELSDMLTSVDTLLTSVGNLNQNTDRDELLKINKLISDIKSKWRATYSLDSILNERERINILPDSPKSTRISNDKEQIIAFLRREDLPALATERLMELTNNLQNQQFSFGMGWAWKNTDTDSKKSIMKDIKVAQRRESQLLRATLQAMPYTLKFYSSDVSLPLASLRNAAKYKLSEIYEIFLKELKQDSNQKEVSVRYEWWLEIAFMFGTLNKWELAELVCKQALSVGKDSNFMAIHEAYFLLSICCRKNNPEHLFRRHLEGIELVDYALSIKQPNEPENYIDPRYLKEKGTHILLMHKEFHQQAINSKFPLAEQGLDLLFQALELCQENDSTLIIQIYNNIIFYYIDSDSISNIEELKEYREKLLDLQQEIEPDEMNWPPFVLDTIAWSKWRLYKNISPEKCETKILKRLQKALESKELNAHERSDILNHLHIVENSITSN